MQMTFYFRIILSCILVVLSIKIEAQSTLIEEQRQWADAKYANPEKMSDSDILSHANDIIFYNLQEESATKLLESLGERIPEVKDYAAFRRSGAIDTLYHHNLSVLKALSDFASTKFPASFMAYMCEYSFATAVNQIKTDRSLLDNLRGKLEKNVKKSSEKDLQALLCIVKMDPIINSVFINPSSFPEVFRLEKEALGIYPWNSGEKTLMKGRLYYNLALLKNIVSYDNLVSIEHHLAGEIPGMDYVLVGEAALYPCNSHNYFLKAIEIGDELLNPGHPFVQEMLHAEYDFRSSLFNLGEESEMEARRLNDYIKSYYPENSIESALCRIACSNTNQSSGNPDIDGFYIDKAFDILKTSLGENHAMYVNNMAITGQTRSFCSPDEPNKWMDTIYDLFDKYIDGKHGEEIAFVGTQATISLYQLYGEAILENINLIKENYLKSHSPSIPSISLGRELYGFYAYTLNDWTTAIEISNAAVSDLEKLAKKNRDLIPMLWDLKLSQTCFKVNENQADTDVIFGKVVAELNKTDFPQRRFINYLYELNWADFKSRLSDYNSAYSMLHRALEYVRDIPYRAIEVVGMMSFYSQRIECNKEELDSLVNQSVKYVDKVIEDKRYGNINYNAFDQIIDYLNSEFRFDEALRMKKAQMTLYEKQFLNLDTYAYYRMKYELASIYESMNDLNEASRIYSEVEESLDNAYNNVPSPELLDILWDDYYRVSRQSQGMSWEKSNKLGKIANLTNFLANANGKNPAFIYSYVVQSLSELLQWAANMMRYKEDLDFAQLDQTNMFTEDGKKRFMDMLNSFEINSKEIFEVAKDVKEKFIDYDPSYKSNQNYLRLVNALAAYYQYVEHDIQTALELKKELLPPGMTNSWNYVFNESLAYDYFMIGDYDNAGKLLAEAEKAANKLNDLTMQDVLNLNALRYNLALKRGNYSEAKNKAALLFSVQKGVLDYNFQLMTTSEQNIYQNTFGDPAIYYARLAEYIPDDISCEAYDAVIYRTGMQLRSQRETRRVLERSEDPQVKMLLDSLTVLKRRMNEIDLSYAFFDQELYNQNHTEHLILNKQANRIERQLLDATKDLRRNDLTDVSWSQIRDKLKYDEAAIEYLFSDNYVMALIVRQGYSKPQAVKLCSVDSLWGMIKPEGINSSAALAKHLYNGDDTALYSRLWEPNEIYLDGVKRVFITLPGALSYLALNAFATSDGQRLFDHYDIVQLSTTAQIAFDRPFETPKTIAMMGDILYSPSQTPTPANGNREIDVDDSFDIPDFSVRSGSDDEDSDDIRGFKKTYFKFLPYTGKELDDIASLFPSSAVVSERRLTATESRLSEMVDKRPDIIHLATHGFYISTFDKMMNHPFFQKRGAGPMQRSGIALAGAELTWKGIGEQPDENDGIVTAEEVANYDLKGTGLVVLSACETALGDTSFEGVFGLQRGFKQAGVRSLLVSLWSVNDASTALFMSHFYRGLLAGDSRQSAWRNAVSKVREKYPQPYYWAPFIMLDGV